MQRLLPRLVLFIGDVRAAISDGHRLARRHLAALRPGSISASSRSSPQTPSFLRVQGVRLEFGGLALALVGHYQRWRIKTVCRS